MLADKRVIAGLLVLNCLLLALLIALERSGDHAWAQPQGAVGNATMALVTGVPSVSQDEPIFLVDSRNEVICVYEFNPGTRKFGLKAARSYKYDKELEEFQNERPSVKDVKDGRVGIQAE